MSIQDVKSSYSYGEQSLISESSAMVVVLQPDMPIIRITATIHLFAKRVGIDWQWHKKPPCLRILVCVSALMIEEIKRIIKTSEIMK